MSEDVEVVIGSDEDELEAQASSETEELSLLDRFVAFKGKTFDFSLKLINPNKIVTSKQFRWEKQAPFHH